MNKIKTLILVILLSNLIFASGGGSLYTRYGVGDLIHTGSTSSLSMGITGVSIARTNTISVANPATWYRLNLTRFEAGLNYTALEIDDNGSKTTFNETEFNGFRLGFPLQRDYGLVWVMGIEPYSNVQYAIKTEVKNQLNDYYARFEGRGGISKVYTGLSYKLPFNFVIGASLDYYTGTIEYESYIDFISNTSLENGSIKTEKFYHGLGITLGLLSPDLSEYLGSDKVKNLHFGLSYAFSSDISTDSTLYSGNGSNYYEVNSAEVKTTLPSKLNLGISFTYNENYNFAFEYLYSPYSDYKFAGKSSTVLNNIQRIGFGLEYKKAETSQYESLLKQMAFRIGFSYEKSQYKFNNEQVDGFALHSGFSFPMGLGSNIDVGFEYGTRGKSDQYLMKENYFKTMVTISFGELWFLRQDR